jgi:hypothetical protein
MIVERRVSINSTVYSFRFFRILHFWYVHPKFLEPQDVLKGERIEKVGKEHQRKCE